MFLLPGLVPEATWIDEATQFVERTDLLGRPQAATFASRAGGPAALARRLAGALPLPEQGLMLPRLLYDQVGGHPATDAPEAGLLARIGRRRIVTLRTAALLAMTNR